VTRKWSETMTHGCPDGGREKPIITSVRAQRCRVVGSLAHLAARLLVASPRWSSSEWRKQTPETLRRGRLVVDRVVAK
jgi:hypothetical protein